MKTLLSLLTALLLAGCASYVEVDGKRYRKLSDSEVQRLVDISRASLSSSLKKRIISRQEYREAMREEPQIRIVYRGDAYGDAYLIWRTSGRQLEFRYHDDLRDTVITRTSFSVSNIPDEDRRIVPDRSVPGR